MHKFILGNWKMNKGNNEILEFCSVFNTLLKDYKKQHFLQNIIIAIAPTFTGLIPFYSKIDSSIITMAQNVSDELSGARTGQISSKMLSDMQVKYCLIGHSEVRQYLFETDQVINKKIKLLLNQNIIPVLCIGETLIDFEQNKTVEIVQNQLRECLKDIKLNDETIIIAYEPIWAIGTGKTATNEIIRNVISSIRNYIVQLFNDKHTLFKIVYGGSVTDTNALEIIGINGNDGLLVGGASLDPQKFMKIILSAK